MDQQKIVRQILDAVKASGRDALTAPEGKLICDAYGITVPQEGLAKSAADAKKLAREIGYPVVMKIVSPDILHKTEAGGVVVGIKNEDEALQAYDHILANARKYKAHAQLVGVQVQQMVHGGVEVIIGAVTDIFFFSLAGEQCFDGVNDQRLTGAGLAGDNVHPRRRLPVDLFYNAEVFYR